MLRSATEHYARQRRIQAAGLVAARAARARGPVAVAQAVAAFQLLAARDAADSVPLMLAEQGIDSDPVGSVAVTSLAGVASDGRPLVSLFEQATTDLGFGLMVVTQLQDVARIAAGVGMVADRSVTGYVRMLNTPSCSRCVILAGKWFRWNEGFQRHPRCDCRHIPSRENIAGDLRTNPDTYFHSLSPADQDKVFTKAGAQAVRDGADLNAVVNARRGMSTAQVPGVGRVVSTTEGTSSRGFAFRTLGGRTERRGEELAIRNTRSGPELRRVHRERAVTQRLMPESIYGLARDRTHAMQLLEKHGYLVNAKALAGAAARSEARRTARAAALAGQPPRTPAIPSPRSGGEFFDDSEAFNLSWLQAHDEAFKAQEVLDGEAMRSLYHARGYYTSFVNHSGGTPWYKEMNAWLRSNKDVSADVTDAVANFYRLFAQRGIEATKSLVVYRGSHHWSDLPIVEDDGFVSTSISSYRASAFGTVAAIEVPAGSVFLPGNLIEKELVFPPGSVLQLIDPGTDSRPRRYRLVLRGRDDLESF